MLVDAVKIGQRIYDTRKEKGMTLQEIADSLGVARSTIQRYEKGLIDGIKLPVIEAIAKCLGVNPAWILYKSDKKERKIIDELPAELKNQPIYVAFHSGAFDGLDEGQVKMITDMAKFLRAQKPEEDES